MRKLWFLLLFNVSFMGCTKRMSPINVIGNWWSIEDDSTYSEVYINEDEWVFNHESYGPIRYKYVIINDSLAISDTRNVRMKNWEIVRSSITTLVIRSNKEEKKLYKLTLSHTYFEAIRDSVAFENFQEEFIKRYLIKSKLERYH